MYQLSDSVTRKFTEILEVSDYEIWTPEGLVDISKVMQTIEYDALKLVLENGMSIECADDHIVILENGEQVFVKDLTVGDRIRTEDGPSPVVECFPLGYQEQMYDVEVDSDSHLYYSNGIVSHNTTTAAAILLWHAIFKKKYDIAIVAQQRGQAVEILDRIRDMYENLPWWMQVGVFSLNRGSIKLGNKSRIYTAAATAGGLRGKSCHLLFCVDGETKITFIDDYERIFYTTIEKAFLMQANS